MKTFDLKQFRFGCTLLYGRDVHMSIVQTSLQVQFSR